VRGKRPHDGRGAEKCDEFPPPHGTSLPPQTSVWTDAITFGRGADCASQQKLAANVADGSIVLKKASR
jgi:hypothetical protein